VPKNVSSPGRPRKAGVKRTCGLRGDILTTTVRIRTQWQPEERAL
jgi:hypothetical protein